METTKYEICQQCQSPDVDYWQTRETTDVGWSDGLGSPGQLLFNYNNFECRKCGHYWKEQCN